MSWTRTVVVAANVLTASSYIVLRPHVAVPIDQAWFWTERWQQMEREADDAIVAGCIATTEGINEFLDELDS